MQALNFYRDFFMKNKLFIFSLSMAMLTGITQNINADAWFGPGLISGWATNIISSLAVMKVAEWGFAHANDDIALNCLIGTSMCALQLLIPYLSLLATKKVSGKDEIPKIGLAFVNAGTAFCLESFLYAYAHDIKNGPLTAASGISVFANMAGNFVAACAAD